MIDLKQGYFLVIEIERKVRIDMQQLCTRLAPTWQYFGTITCDGLHGIMKLYIDKP